MHTYTCLGCNETFVVSLPLIPGGMIQRGFCSPGCELFFHTENRGLDNVDRADLSRGD